MESYHKIQTVFKRDPETNYKTLLMGDYSLPEFEYLKDCEWIFTEKVDGMNIRVMWDGAKVRFGGKSDNAQIPAQLSERLYDLFQDADRVKSVLAEGPVCIYGEGYGAGIQKAGVMYGPSKDFILFDVKYGDMWLQRKDVEDIAMKLDLAVVPEIGRGTLHDMVFQIQQGITLSVVANCLSIAEGIVARPATELRTRRGDRMITKLKVKDF